MSDEIKFLDSFLKDLCALDPYNNQKSHYDPERSELHDEIAELCVRLAKFIEHYIACKETNGNILQSHKSNN